MPGKPGRFAGHFILKRNYENFLASSKNLVNPISVKGCFNNPKIDSNGDVTTSAPASAHLIIWFGERIDAAKISDLYPCTRKICASCTINSMPSQPLSSILPING